MNSPIFCGLARIVTKRITRTVYHSLRQNEVRLSREKFVNVEHRDIAAYIYNREERTLEGPNVSPKATAETSDGRILLK